MLSRTPPMGWNSWNTFGKDISEELIMQTADAMVETGLKDVGYEYVVIDDCWAKRERENGKLVADSEKFPNGMKFLADYIHSKGLKFGMYADVGSKTCAGYPGSLGYEYTDAQTFADWGVDYLKHDYCHKPEDVNGEMCYHKMAMALKATGREILFSGCNCGDHDAKTWMRRAGAHMYRSTCDIGDNFFSMKDTAISQIHELGYSHPGCFNDLDMLIVGMRGKGNRACGGCSDNSYMLHFAWWCMFMSPLMIGCDIRNMDDTTKAILTNKDLIAIDQDEECRPPILVGGYSGERMVFFRHLSGGEYAVLFVNTCIFDEKLHIEFCDIGLTDNSGLGLEFYDIYEQKNLGVYKGGFTARVPFRGCKIYRVRPVKA